MAGPFSIITGLLGEQNPEDAIASWSDDEQKRNRAAVGLDANGNPLPQQTDANGNPVPPDPNAAAKTTAAGQAAASGVMQPQAEPNATKTPPSLGHLMMDLQQYDERNQGFNQALGLGFAAFAQPRDREMVSKAFNVNMPDPLKIAQTQQDLASQQQGQDRSNAIGMMINDPVKGPQIASALNMPGSTMAEKITALKAAYAADPQNIGRMITSTQLPTPDVANLEQIQRLQQQGANSSETALLTPALIAKIGGPAAEKAIGDAAAYRASHKGQTAPWVTPAGVDVAKYTQFVNDQKTISDNQADAGSTFQGTTDTLNTLRQKLGNLKNDPDLARVLSLPQDSLEKNAFQEALRNQNADWKDKIPQVLLIDPGAMRVLSDLKEATGQEYTGALQSILGHGLRPTAQEIAQVRAGYGQTQNILNFSNVRDYNTQAIDPMLTRMDQAAGKAYGDAGQIDKAPDYVRPFINPIYLHGGKYHLDDGTDVPAWETNVNKPMSDQDVQDAKAAIKANSANAWHVVDGIRRKGYDVSRLAAMPGVDQ